VAARPLSVLRLGDRLRRHHAQRRPPADLRPLRAQWSFGAHTCPFCENDDRALITSFATRDGRYRVYGCDVCRRYLKAYDGRNALRPVMVAVDSIATLPLDAAAMQRGYS
jgi:formate dehydrogenase maturation protein FdhE